MEHTSEMSPETAARRAAIQGLAVVGFFALVFIGMVLAIYAARFVPKAANGVGSAAVYLSSLFTPAAGPSLVAVPSTIPFGATASSTATSTMALGTATSTPATTTAATQPVKTPGPKTTTTYPITTVATPAPLYGLPDLAVSITAVGYLDNGTTDTFIASTNVPAGKQGAVKFTVRNAGTNVTGSWNFNAVLPTNPTYTFTSPTENSLAPGDRIDFVLAFDHNNVGTARAITVTVDPNNSIVESNEGNNTDASSINIQ